MRFKHKKEGDYSMKEFTDVANSLNDFEKHCHQSETCEFCKRVDKAFKESEFYSVSEWIKLGKIRGYEAYLKQQWRDDLLKELPREKDELDENWGEKYMGWNDCLQSVKNEIKRI